ncbi:BTB/POZ domain-containing protein POB1-like [Arachis stenosperma]|uniref:BTB/POZ domain-containing protein POB1-like n=1 Tax=Arachis stenosperma TaxID=217475 RepID=UPI0025AC4EB0|nr:BTB/POZ domain-containing protein POB1-like [Arachis stenosperma]
MVFNHSRSTSSCSDVDFSFAFNDSKFSDRILRIEIVENLVDDEHCLDSDGDDYWNRQYRRQCDDIHHHNYHDFYDERILITNQADIDNCVLYENQEKETTSTNEERLSGDESSHNHDWSSDCSIDVRVRTLYISSPILAAKSPFFYKLFSNGMKESEQTHVTIRINASEEAAVVDLLNFMYTNMLSASSATALLDVLMAADKFEVASCMRYCSQLLRNMPMTSESALLYLELPFTLLMADAVQPLTHAARQYLASIYKDILKFQEEVMSLPLVGIEAILSSDDLQITSEDALYDIVLKWARSQYPDPEERKHVLSTRLARLIRFPYMSCRKLKKVLCCNEMEREIATKLVFEALFFKAEAPHQQRILVESASASKGSNMLAERAYKYRPLRVLEFEAPRQQCMVYLDLKREECANLFPSGRVYSQAFHLGGQGFFLSAHCNMDQESSFHCFGLFLGMQEKGSISSVDYEFAVRCRPTDEFVSKYKGNYTFTGGKAVGYRNLFAIPWTSFMADDCLYFINDVLHLRAELTIRQNHSLHST